MMMMMKSDDDDDSSLEKIQERYLGQHFQKYISTDAGDGTTNSDAIVPKEKYEYDGAPQVNNYLDSLLVKEFTKLSLQERDKSYEELHGVNDVDEETPEFVERSLHAMNQALEERITLLSDHTSTSTTSSSSNKDAYLLAETQDKEYVTNPKFRLMFLRAERFDPIKAARRLVAFFEGKLQYFGKSLLTKRIQFSDLDKDDRACLKGGRMQIMPSRDRGGRAIFCDMNMVQDTSYKRPINRLKVWIYIMLTLLEEEENQKRGVVMLLMQLGSINPANINRELTRENPRIMKWIPLRVSGLHYCIEDPLFATLCRLSLVASPPDIRTRHRLHFGAHTELMYIIMTFGIPVDLFPMNAQNIIKKTNHNRWIARRKIKESALQQTGSFSGIDLPNRQDVLIGKGKPIQDHVGNMKFRGIIEEHMAEYIETKRGEKAVVINKVLDAVLASSARFLAKDEQGWWNEVSSKEARDKISKAFLTAGTRRNRSQNVAASAAAASSPHDQQEENEGAGGSSSASISTGTGTYGTSKFFQPDKRRKFEAWTGCCR